MRFLLLSFLFLLSARVYSVGVDTDTIPYTIGKYDIKQQMKVSALAEKLKVDAAILIKLNKFRSANSILVKGQRVKIPVYQKVNKPKPVKEVEKKAEKKPAKKPKEKDVKKGDSSPKAKPVVSEVAVSKPAEALKPSDIEKAMVRLIMIDAILELNEAMMEGVKASLDSLELDNTKDRNTQNPSLYARDRMLMPYILHIQDSLSKEIISLQAEKKEIEAKIYPPKVSTDTMVSGDEIIVYEVSREAEPIRPRSRVPDVKADSIAAIKIRIPNSKDTMVIKPIAKQKETPPSATRNPGRTGALSRADSVKRIKAEFFLRRARKVMEDKSFKTAESYLQKSIELYPNYFDSWLALAETHDRMGSHNQALKDYQECFKIDSTQPRLYFSIGNCYAKLKKRTEAIYYYNKAITLDPNNIPSLVARASILAEAKNYKQAIDDYDQVLKIDRLYHNAYKARGKAKLIIKDFASAMDDFTRFLIFEQTDPSAFYYRGLAKIGSNELLDGCMDLSTSAAMGYSDAEKAIKKSCR